MHTAKTNIIPKLKRTGRKRQHRGCQELRGWAGPQKPRSKLLASGSSRLIETVPSARGNVAWGLTLPHTIRPNSKVNPRVCTNRSTTPTTAPRRRLVSVSPGVVRREELNAFHGLLADYHGVQLRFAYDPSPEVLEALDTRGCSVAAGWYSVQAQLHRDVLELAMSNMSFTRILNPRRGLFGMALDSAALTESLYSS